MVILTFIGVWGYKNKYEGKNTHSFMTQEWPCSTFCLFLFGVHTSIFVIENPLCVQSRISFIDHSIIIVTKNTYD